MSWASRATAVKPTSGLTPELCKEDIIKLNCSVKATIQVSYDMVSLSSRIRLCLVLSIS